jgi:hypothetical protein
MSFDQFSDPDEPGSSAGSPDDPTTELEPAVIRGERPDGPVSFIRESWLVPPSSRFPRGGDTDPLPVVDGGRSLNLPGWARRLTAGLAVFVFGLICCLSYAAVHNANAASKWQQRAITQAALTQKVSDQLKQANDHITTLDGTVGSLQGQLATVTSQAKQNSGIQGVLRRLWPFG